MPKGIYTAASTMYVEAQALDVAARNLAHATTPGYRKEVALRGGFAEALQQKGHRGDAATDGGTGILSQGSYFDQHQGVLEPTGAALDVAITGDAFLRVTDDKGRNLLTRAGHLTQDANGRLTTPDGWTVQGQGGAIVIPRGADGITIDPKGRIIASSSNGGVRTETTIEQLRLVVVDKPAALTPVNGQYFDPGEQPTRDATAYEVHQGQLEKSNVDPIQELVSMISIQRRYDAAQKAMREQTNAGQGFSDLLRGTTG